ncbi:MAG: hypothetical protein CFE25_17160 [Chitinophagaceae bacterium BSSC1]|nr:MAG: hypothetical protein CFE25_17160 [Chitinophagaceae bacterium BSSC1]
MIRNAKWDMLPNTVAALKSTIRKQNENGDAFKKSNSDSPNFKNAISALAVSTIETNGYAKQVTDQFRMLKSDYDKKIINAARYKEALKPLHELLVGMGQKIQISDLPADEIAQQLQLVGY